MRHRDRRRYRPVDDFNEEKPYADQINQMNFLFGVPTKRIGESPSTDPERLHLVAPYTQDPEQWTKMRWLERYSGREGPITTEASASALVAEVKSIRDVYEACCRHPEPSSLGPDGEVYGKDTVGLLKRLPVRALWIDQMGKESNRLENIDRGE